MKKTIIFLILISFLIQVIPTMTIAEEDETGFCVNIVLDGINAERNSSQVVLYNSDKGTSTGTSGSGTEVIVGADGTVEEVISGSDSPIPSGGFVISAGAGAKRKISGIKKGFVASVDGNVLTVISKDYSPFFQVSLDYNNVNGTRTDNTVIIYKDKFSTGTNIWGYEAVVDSEGVIVSVGGNNNEIPEGGFVISAVGNKKQPLIDAAQKGMSAVLDTTSKKVLIGYTKENASKKYSLAIESVKSDYYELYYSLYDFQLFSVDRSLFNSKIELLESLRADLETAIAFDDYLSFAQKDYIFDINLKEMQAGLLPETPVEARTLWLRIPSTSRTETVQKVCTEIKDMGFNSVCIEFLFDNTTISPMPEGSLFEQNPAFNGQDMLKLYTDEFHRLGIEVHLWMSCLRVGYEGSTNTSRSVGCKKPEWRLVSQKGSDVVSNEYGDAFFLNPALPKVKELLLGTYRYILENYDIDGFQLDYVRYPESTGHIYGYDQYTVDGFCKKFGYSSAPESSGQPGWDDWKRYRADFVTDIVFGLKSLRDEIRPDVWLSADVAPASLTELSAVMCQDAVGWVRSGLIDILYPMAYGTTDAVERWASQAKSLCGNSVYSVIGLRDNGVEDYSDQIVVCRTVGVGGTAFFSYSQYIAGGYKGNIESVVFKNAALNPTSGSKAAITALLASCSKKLDDYKKIAELSALASAFDVEGLIGSIGFVKDLIGKSGVSASYDDIIALAEEMKKVSDDTADIRNALLAGLSRLTRHTADMIILLCVNCKDDEKAAYSAEHTASSDVSEDGSDNAEPQEGSQEEKKELSAFEKVFQVFFVIIMTVGLIGLPLFYYLDKRRRRIAKEYDRKNGPSNESSEDEPAVETESDNSEKIKEDIDE